MGASRRWWLVAAALIAAFLARTPLYLSVLPPFEGWDEYQHLAYIVHVDETGTLPVYESRVPASLRPLAVSMPHSVSGSEQLHDWGVLSYGDFWTTPARSASTPPPASAAPRLYQSQHPPLAYVLAVPVWRALKTAHPLEAIYTLRALNVLVVAAALVLLAAALERLVPAFGPRVAVLALVCLHPLFFQNVARVANDGLAVATGIAGISLLVLIDRRTLASRSVLAAACLAASVWSKQTSLTIIPALALLPLLGWGHRVPPGRVWRATMAAGVAFIGLTALLWVWNYQRYGVILTTQDSVELAARGSTSAALAEAVLQVPWGSVVDTFVVPGRPWVGGWSYLALPPALSTLHGWYWGALLAAAVGGAIIAVRRRFAPVERAAIGDLGVCAAVVVFTTLGMTYHIVLSQAVYGRVMTNPWYFMTALPFFFVLLVRGLDAIDRRFAIGAAGGLAVLYVAIDLYGTWIEMPAAYTDISRAALQWARLSTIHPALLNGARRWWFLGVQVCALALVAAALLIARLPRSHANSRRRTPLAP